MPHGFRGPPPRPQQLAPRWAVAVADLPLHEVFRGLKLAEQGLADGTASSADLLEDLLVESGERVAKFCAKSVRVLGINFNLVP